MANKIVDIDWQFGVTAASSQKDLVGKSFLQMKITIDNGKNLESIDMELSISQFYNILHELHKVRNKMDFVT